MEAFLAKTESHAIYQQLRLPGLDTETTHRLLSSNGQISSAVPLPERAETIVPPRLFAPEPR